MPATDIYEQIMRGEIAVHHKSPVVNRFWAKVSKDGPRHPVLGKCWLWVGGSSGGYGSIFSAGRKQKVHRYAYKLLVGDVADNICVLHRCDNPSCVNPEHLFLGTQQDNIADMVSKNRQTGAVGERNGNTKLTEDQVREVRRLYRYKSRTHGIYALAERFGVSDSTIHFIVQGKRWKHVQ